MNREQARYNLPAIIHWANGGNLWYYSNGSWHKHHDNEMGFMSSDRTHCIIEDKHFEARKAHALGKPIQCKHLESIGWSDVGGDVKFSDRYEYRVKPTLVKKYQWVLEHKGKKTFKLTDRYYATEEEVEECVNTTFWIIIGKFQRSEIVEFNDA